MIKEEAIAQPCYQEQTSVLATAMLAAKTLGELYALMEEYSFLEVMAEYNQFPATLQAKFNDIYCRDTQAQMAAIYTTGSDKQFSAENKPLYQFT